MDFLPELTSKIAPRETISSFVTGKFVSLWLAVLAGLLLGWSWRPRWAAALVFSAVRSRSRIVWTAPPGFGARRVWIAFLTVFSVFSLLKRILRIWKVSSTSLEISVDDPRGVTSDDEDERAGVTENDLDIFLSYINGTDGGPIWQLMMDQATPTLSYQAWRRDPEFGPTQYRTRTVFENVTPELIRDFYWDDEFRTKWDDMLIYFRILEEHPSTGTMIVHWIRKFPFFCSDREYVIIRRIWEAGSTYNCITKDNPYPSLARHRKPRRVNLYYSSWRIKPVESRNGGELTACEVLLFHYEEMGIPRELAKIGVQRAMWGLVRKMDIGVQAYKMAQASGAPPSRYAIMARITSRIPYPTSVLPDRKLDDAEGILEQVETHKKPKPKRNIVKWLIIGGVLIMCGLKTDAIGKGLAFGFCRSLRRVQKHKVGPSQSPETATNQKRDK